jgi:hypothetical protein
MNERTPDFCILPVTLCFFMNFMFFSPQAAEMAQRLSGINRWCISGTPVQRGLEGNIGFPHILPVFEKLTASEE